MRFKLSQITGPKHDNIVTCINWNNTEELFSSGDDHKLLKCNLITKETTVVTTLPDNFFPTSLHLYPKISFGVSNKQTQDNLLLTTADGRFHIISQSGRIEKSVNAHQGACLIGQWSPDGSGFLTAGEDGVLRIWSRSGLARTIIGNVGVPIYSAVWGPNGTAILYMQTNKLIISHLQGNTKSLQWKAHEGLILSVSWNITNNLILSGAEDGTFKTWDAFGQLLSSSIKHDVPITAVAWSPMGDLFTIAGYNLLRLCDHTGWSQCLEYPNSGSIQNIAWSADGTQLAAACANGHVLFSHIIEKQIEWKDFSCLLTGRKTINITDIVNSTTEQLDFSTRVVQMTIGHGYLIVVTTNQCHIHSAESWNTPIIFDLKDNIVHLALISERCFCLLEKTGVNIYNFLGRLIASPRWGSMRTETLSKTSVTLGPENFAVIDQNDPKIVHVFDLPTGIAVKGTSDHSANTVSHIMPVSHITLNQSGPAFQRQLAIIDFNRDMYVLSLKESKSKFNKIAVQVRGMIWCEDASILIGLKENKLVIFGSPRTPAFYQFTTIYKDVNNLGKNSVLLRVDEGYVVICRGDGAILYIAISPFPIQLAKKVAANQWSHALKMCRIIKDETLWACLAALAWEHKELDIAEEAFAIIKQPHQVEYINQIKNPTMSGVGTF